MAVAVDLKEKYIRLSEANQQTIFYMAKLIVERGDKEFKNGETGEFIDKVSNDIEVNKPTVQRLYYTYVSKHPMSELKELAALFGCDVVVGEINSPVIELNEVDGKKQMLLFKNDMVDVHKEDGKYFFILDELLDVLPVSRNNKILKNALSIKSRKMLEVDGKKVQAIDADKVKNFLQNFIRQLQEGQQKNDIRLFIEKVHQLTLNTNTVFAEPVVQELKPIEKDLKQEVKPVEVKIIREEPTITSKVEVEIQNPEPRQETVVKSFKALKTEIKKVSTTELKTEIKKVSTSELYIDEDKEIKALTKMVAGTIGYLSPQAKEKMRNMVKTNGLVATTTATIQMLNDIQKDTSLYFVNKIGQLFDTEKDDIRYELTHHAVKRGKERANATPEQIIKMAKEAVFYAETQTKKYVQYNDYILVLGKSNEHVNEIITVLLAEWFEDGIIMQEQIDRHA